MADKLELCPFCGGEATLVEDIYNDQLYNYVICTNDDCNANTGRCSTEDEAITKWNNRPSPWHTGTPTEEGWYLLHYPKSKEQPYELAQWNGEHFVAVKPFHEIIVRIEASSVPYWQKIKED